MKLVAARAENLRGYTLAEISFPELRILVGENNEGKSSLLKMVHRLVADYASEFWDGSRVLPSADQGFWMPANNTAGRARRLTLLIEMCDGRTARSFSAKKGDVLELRFGIRKVDSKARLNIGSPRKAERHDHKAVEMLRQLSASLTLLLIPPVRDATSSRYAEHLLKDVRRVLIDKFSHTTRGGTSKEYRKARGIIDSLSEIVKEHSAHFEVSGETVLSRMIRDSSVRFSAEIDDLAEWVLSRIGVVLSTGAHDELMVSPAEVGNGLQSLIDLSLAIARAKLDSAENKDVLIFVEEPEAFLHPAGQRELMLSIREHCQPGDCRMVLTTHSPVIIDESEFPEVALVRNHRVHEPHSTSEVQDKINSGLMASKHAEAFFADAVLLVEGDTDAAYLGALLKRLRAANPTNHGLSKVHIQPIYGKTFFAPWIKLFESYATGNEKPIEYLCLVDSDALDREGGRLSAVETALRDCGKSLAESAMDAAQSLCDLDYKAYAARREAASLANQKLDSHRFFTFSIDLEWAIVDAISPTKRQKLQEMIGVEEDNKLTIARALGSKAGSGRKKKGARKPSWIFAQIAQMSDRVDVPGPIVQCLDHIFELRGWQKWRALKF